MIQIGRRFKNNIAAAFVLVVLSLLVSGTCSAEEYVRLRLYPEHVGVFTTVMKQQFVVFGINADGVSTNITEQVDWESSDPNIVTIDESGMATVAPDKTAGQVKISCTYPKTGKLHPGVHMLLLKPTTKL